LRGAPVSVFLKRVPRRGVADQVRRCLRQGPARLGLDSAARQLAMSPATLRRHLQAEGTGWRQLKDEWRRDRAIALLAHSPAPLAELAEQLGFCDASALARAFRHWTGSAPGAYRARAADN
jgi:AraC-like DNA-binding protein